MLFKLSDGSVLHLIAKRICDVGTGIYDRQANTADERRAREGGKRSQGRRGKKRKPLGKIFGQVLFVLIVAFLISVLVSVLNAKRQGETPALFGYQLYVVESGSMSPTLKVGSVILSKEPEDAAALKIGDIVTFRSNVGDTVTHRIIDVIELEDGTVKYQTKGDNPINSPDPDLLDPGQIIAKMVMKIPFA